MASCSFLNSLIKQRNGRAIIDLKPGVTVLRVPTALAVLAVPRRRVFHPLEKQNLADELKLQLGHDRLADQQAQVADKLVIVHRLELGVLEVHIQAAPFLDEVKHVVHREVHHDVVCQAKLLVEVGRRFWKAFFPFVQP